MDNRGMRRYFSEESGTFAMFPPAGEPPADFDDLLRGAVSRRNARAAKALGFAPEPPAQPPPPGPERPADGPPGRTGPLVPPGPRGEPVGSWDWLGGKLRWG
jgi:hypothetical protein